jgi:hypothetical protein
MLFSECTNLKEVTLPASLVYINPHIFRLCGEVTVTYEGTSAQWNSLAKSETWAEYVMKVTVICSDGSKYVYTY